MDWKGKEKIQEKGLPKYGDGVAWFRGAMIGKGGFGRVYLATSKNPRSKYSCLPSVMAVKSAEVSVSGSIQKEREVYSNVKGCPNIIRCFGEETTTGENGLMVFNLLLEYGSGGTLADRIKKLGGHGMSESEVRVYARSVLQGLNHIHGTGYVHCDLKPDNVLLVHSCRRTGVFEFRAKIGDFGLAKRSQGNKKRKLEPCWRGTPRYLAPEAVVDNVQEFPSDIWAFGCMVLEMLTGKPPWDGEMESNAVDILRKIKEGLPKIPNDISKEARDFLKSCFVKKPMFRLTAEMLLNHPFLEGVDVVEDGDEEFEEVEDLNEIESFLLVYESDDELSSSSFHDYCSIDSGEDFFNYLSEEDVDDEFVSSNFDEGKSKEAETKGITSSIDDSGFDQSIKASMSSRNGRQYPISHTIPAGV
ncbi:mitogen-activated kinase kinase kinase YODA-like [Olea europaea subsp. europaea]|uniref:Mitogen-activated kinase kinase kinase YODA-like n=1 Tax=Olea europaea subsp. europaea TaxID=158383 RepID=A0A8S0U8V9_OLEEU|nr:mitogen-activated kinase kinase kinase YODA-like [Olea europaea subsp. europaea]